VGDGRLVVSGLDRLQVFKPAAVINEKESVALHVPPPWLGEQTIRLGLAGIKQPSVATIPLILF
jgi:hypothetical protein